jgi:hypothetical protein
LILRDLNCRKYAGKKKYNFTVYGMSKFYLLFVDIRVGTEPSDPEQNPIRVPVPNPPEL